MARIIVSNVDNYLFLTRNFSKQSLLDRDDIIVECYIVFDECLKDFDVTRNIDFFFYLNKSLRRRIMRIVEKEFKKHHQNFYSTDEFELLSNESQLKVDNDADFTLFYITKKMGLNIQEKKVAISRLRKQTIDEFVIMNKDIDKNTYYNILKNLKEKLKNLE